MNELARAAQELDVGVVAVRVMLDRAWTAFAAMIRRLALLRKSGNLEVCGCHVASTLRDTARRAAAAAAGQRINQTPMQKHPSRPKTHHLCASPRAAANAIDATRRGRRAAQALFYFLAERQRCRPDQWPVKDRQHCNVPATFRANVQLWPFDRQCCCNVQCSKISNWQSWPQCGTLRMPTG
jgi:hypothetical protein